MRLALLIALIPALAIGGTPSPEPTPSVVATGGQANAASIAGSVSGAESIATGGAGGEGGAGGAANAIGEGGAGGAATAEQSQEATARSDASNTGNHQGVTITHRRNAPSIAQGSLMASGCGAGANGGGSREGGAGFLGFVWTTDQCYQLLAAASFAAIGMPDTSCDLLVGMKSVQRAFERAGKPLPDCTSAENRDLVTAAAELTHGLATIERMKPAPQCPDCVTRPELDRAFKKSMEK